MHPRVKNGTSVSFPGTIVSILAFSGRALSCVSEYLCFIDLICAFVSKLCPKVLASLLNDISIYEWFHRILCFLIVGKGVVNILFF